MASATNHQLLEKFIEGHVDRVASGRIRDLHVVYSEDKIILQGRSRTYHAKQLAHQAVLDLTDGHPLLFNQIVITRGTLAAPARCAREGFHRVGTGERIVLDDGEPCRNRRTTAGSRVTTTIGESVWSGRSRIRREAIWRARCNQGDQLAPGPLVAGPGRPGPRQPLHPARPRSTPKETTKGSAAILRGAF